MRTSTIIAILFFVALAIVTVLLVLCQMGNNVKSQFLNDMQPYLNDTITTDVITNVYNDNPTIINAVYNTSRLRNLFNNILSYNKCYYNNKKTAKKRLTVRLNYYIRPKNDKKASYTVS